MTENTLLSTNQSTNAEVEPSNANLPTQKVEGLNLLDLPVFTRSRTVTPVESSFSAPRSYDDGKVVFEYEFTCIFTDSKPMFIGLWDTDDLSACQRVSAYNMDREEIVYNKESGIGFFSSPDGLRWCFKKQVFDRSIGPFNNIVADDLDKPKTRAKETAEDIIAGL